MTCLSHFLRRLAPSLGPLPTRLAAAYFATLAACATVPAPTPDEPRQPSPGIAAGTSSRAGELDSWSKRGEPAQLARAIQAFDQRAANDPRDLDARLMLAEAQHLMAESISVLGWKDQGEPRAHLAASEAAALSAFALVDEAGASELRERRLINFDQARDERAGAALYWLALSVYERAFIDGYESLVVEHAFAHRVVALASTSAPNVDRGGPHRLDARLAAHPADPSLRDVARAKQHAERALSVDPRYAANVLAYIEHYAVPTEDRAAITDKLQQLTEHKPQTPEDVLAHARAQQVASQIEDRLE